MAKPITEYNERLLALMELRFNGDIDIREFIELKTLAACEAGLITYQMYLNTVSSRKSETS